MRLTSNSMFRKLRNHLILVNVAVATIVLFVAFASIYLVAEEAAARRPINNFDPVYSAEEASVTISFHIKAERRASLNSLLGSLITVGALVEFIVVILSYFWAESAIRPVREAYEAQKTFIANASHEIKTPLAAITANLEAADITGNRWIDNAEREVQKLADLNRELLTLTRIDGINTATSRPENVALEPFLQEITNSFAARAKDRGIKINLQVVPPQAKLLVSKLDLEQLVSILLDNAIKYSSSEIKVSYHDRKITVENDGTTIPKEALPHIFERFYQADKSSSGVGLGLSIASSLAERNHWKLSAESGNTTSFILDLS